MAFLRSRALQEMQAPDLSAYKEARRSMVIRRSAGLVAGAGMVALGLLDHKVGGIAVAGVPVTILNALRAADNFEYLQELKSIARDGKVSVREHIQDIRRVNEERGTPDYV